MPPALKHPRPLHFCPRCILARECSPLFCLAKFSSHQPQPRHASAPPTQDALNE